MLLTFVRMVVLLVCISLAFRMLVFSSSDKKHVIYAMGILIVGIVIFCFDSISDSSDICNKKCEICGKAATYHLQDSYFCDEHANDLVEYYSE